jgi:hypothetical protein
MPLFLEKFKVSPTGGDLEGAFTAITPFLTVDF